MKRTLQSKFIVASLYILANLLFSSQAYCQRGAAYDGQAKPWESTSQGFPGYFDTNVARKDSLVIDFPPMIYGLIPTPSLAIDYGITDTLTIGTNGIVTALPWLFKGAGASIKVRSLLVGNEDHQSTATYYGGGAVFTGETPTTLYYHLVTWNDAWRFGGQHTLSLHANYLRLNLQQASFSDINHAELALTAFMVGGGYGFQFNPRWSLRINTMASVYQSLDSDTAAMSLTQSTTVKKPKATTLFGVAQAEYHPYDKWFFSVGVTAANAVGLSAAAPWFSWAKRW